MPLAPPGDLVCRALVLAQDEPIPARGHHRNPSSSLPTSHTSPSSSSKASQTAGSKSHLVGKAVAFPVRF